MPINNFPFRKFNPKQQPRPMLPVNLINPDTGKIYKTWGLVDTGADECAATMGIANILGLDVENAVKKEIVTAKGKVIASSIKTTLEILHPNDPLYPGYSADKKERVIYRIFNTPIDYAPLPQDNNYGLHFVLLGVKSFLNNFVVTINYPDKKFSIKDHKKIIDNK